MNWRPFDSTAAFIGLPNEQGRHKPRLAHCICVSSGNPSESRFHAKRPRPPAPTDTPDCPRLPILLAVVPTAAVAATACVYDADGGLLEISIEAGERWTVAVAGGGDIVLQSNAAERDCETANVSNTQTIRVRGPAGDKTWFGVRHDGEGGRFPAAITFDIDLGTDPDAQPHSAVDTLVITGRQSADESSSVWDWETRVWALSMNGTNSTVRGPVRLNLALLGGADVHSGTAGRVNGGAGNDDLAIPDDMYGNGQNALIAGGSGNDVLHSVYARVEAGIGNDTITGRMFDVDAGMGDDYIKGQDMDVDEGSRANGADTIIGANLDDFLSYAHRTNGVIVRLDDKPNDGEPSEGDNIIDMIYIDTGSGNDLVVGSDEEEGFSTGVGDDTSFGGGGHDSFYGEGGTDTVYGGPGSDYMESFSGTAIFSGGAGDDLFFATGASDPPNQSFEGNDEAYGGWGDDTLHTYCGNDFVSGGPGNDSIQTGLPTGEVGECSDEDRARGGPGADDLQGGQGDDRLIGDEDVDTAHGGSGIDACDAETEVACEVEAMRAG